MSTPAQIAANKLNAESSTGPRTEAGKAVSSKNAVTLGLFSGDHVRPSEKSLYDELNATVLRELAPVGILEHNLACEIRRAMWRLHRCGEVESTLVGRYDHVDPMEAWDKLMEHTQKAVDRGRSLAPACFTRPRANSVAFRQNANPRVNFSASLLMTQPRVSQTGAQLQECRK